MPPNRELAARAYKALLAAKNYLDERGVEVASQLTASDQREFNKLEATATAAVTAHMAAGAEVPPEAQRDVGAAIEWYDQPANPNPIHMRAAREEFGPLPGMPPGIVQGMRGPFSGAKWGDAVLRSGGRSGMGASLLSPSGTVPVVVPVRGPVVEPTRAQFVRDLLPSEVTSNGYFSYLKQTVRTNNAAVVAEGGRKPTSTYGLQRVDDRVDTIAHLSEPIPRHGSQMLRCFAHSSTRSWPTASPSRSTLR